MISIIICHRSSIFLKQFKQNVAETIGVPYEIVAIDNTTNRLNIFQAYNKGFKLSKYEFLCFAHEDILFHTNGWGKKVLNHFQDSRLGIIGVAGSHYFPKLPGSHWSTGIVSYNIIHTVDNVMKPEFHSYFGNNELSIQATLLDGLWLCIPKTVMKEVRFDDATFTGFHCYDSDICLQIRKLNFDVRIVFDINIEHFSLGKRDNIWLKNIFCLYEKWKNDLPISVFELSKKEKSRAHFMNAKELIDQININKFGFHHIIRTWYYYLRCNPPTNLLNLKLGLHLLFPKQIFFLKKFV